MAKATLRERNYVQKSEMLPKESLGRGTKPNATNIKAGSAVKLGDDISEIFSVLSGYYGKIKEFIIVSQFK